MQTTDETKRNGASQGVDDLTAQLASLTSEFVTLKSEVKHLREKYSEVYKALLMLCCPKEWYTEEIDEKELEEALAHGQEHPTILELIESLKQSASLSDVEPL